MSQIRNALPPGKRGILLVRLGQSRQLPSPSGGIAWSNQTVLHIVSQFLRAVAGKEVFPAA